MKILVLSQYYWPENFRINELTAGLVQKGHEVTVVTGIPNYPEGKYFKGYGPFKNSRQEHNGVRILRLPVLPRGRGDGFSLFLSYLSFMTAALLFTPFICRRKIDLIFFSLSPVAEGVPAVLLKFIKRSSLVSWVQDLWPESLVASKVFRSSFLHGIIRKIVSMIYGHCDMVFVQSRAFIPFVENMGVASGKISYLPNFSEDFYKPLNLDPDAPERKNLPRGFTVIFAGNIGASQDFPTIIAAAEKLKDHSDINWVIIGDGRMRRWAEDEVAARGLGRNFVFLGRHPAEAMPRYFALADVLLVTLRNEEIFRLTIPSKVQSYLACAKPIIASLAGEGARIIEESGAGFSCPPEDPPALAESVLKMYHMDRSERQRMGAKGRKYFENNFYLERSMEQLNISIKGIKGANS